MILLGGYLYIKHPTRCYFGGCIPAIAVTFQANCKLIWAYPFVTKTPVGTESLLRTSDDQRFKFWDDFLFVKSCTKIIPKIIRENNVNTVTILLHFRIGKVRISKK